MTEQATTEEVKDDPFDIRDPTREAEKEAVQEVEQEDEQESEQAEASVSQDDDGEADVDDATPEESDGDAEDKSEDSDESNEVVEESESDKIRQVDPEPFQGEIDPANFLDEDLAKTVLQQQRLINQLMERVEAAGISDPIQGALESVAETFPDVFGASGSLDAKQKSARDQLIESATTLKADYTRKGKSSPGWEKLIKMAMNVDFPDLSERMTKRQTRSKRRESQRLPRPTARQSDMTPEERAVQKLREKMLRMEFGD